MPRYSAVIPIAAIAIAATILYSQTDLQDGYATVTAATGLRAPVGSALFRFSDSSGNVISEAGVGSAEPTRHGRVFVDEAGVQTGIAFANPESSPATVVLTLRGLAGNEIGQRTVTLNGREHLARYVSELFTSRPPSLSGTLTFESDRAISAITLRESRNARGEPLYATLPVADLTAASDTQLTFPQIALGDGYTTQIVLLNRTNQVTQGRVRLFKSDGSPLLARIQGNTVSEIAYRMDGNAAYRADLESVAGLVVGFAVVTANTATDVLPAGAAIFQFRKSGALVTEASVLSAQTSTAVRIFVDQLGTGTGVAVANPNMRPSEVTFDLMDSYGGKLASTTRTLAPNGHLAIFSEELFPAYGQGFSGQLEIRSAEPVAAVTLKVTVNGRGDIVLTTLPVADLTKPVSASSIVFPHIVLGGGFSTRLILINPNSQSANTGRLNFFKSEGTAMPVPLQGQTISQAAYTLASGGARRFLPGNSLAVGSISLRSDSSTEIVVNEGNSVRPQLRIVDTSSQVRDDFDITYSSLDTDVAIVDETGAIQGKRAGFSTLTISTGGYVAAATITVVKVDAGAPGFRINGIAQDLAQRLYMAATTDHAILLAEDLKQQPQVYAGIRTSPGLKDDLRLQSQFRGPAFLAFDQAEGSLYVSDSANNVIRKVQPGDDGQVETLGPRLSNPQGIALDDRGYLWVADSGSHTIRRLQITTGSVETIAGKAGTAGAADGRSDAALFNAPRGIAIERETLAQQLERERRGEPPPPVSVIVADTGNGLLRRVKETGDVETIQTGSPVILPARTALTTKLAVTNPVLFNSPTGVAVDSAGDIFVTESTASNVKVILQNGDVTSAAQPKTLQQPGGLAVSQAGKVVVAQAAASAVEISYGVPQIRSIAPDRVKATGGATVIITGNNFGPDALVITGGTVISRPISRTTNSITFVAPPLPSGRTTVTVQTRGGIAQAALLVDAIPLTDLPVGSISTFAGGSTFSGDGLQARSATLLNPGQLAIDPAGNLYIADAFDNRIRRVTASGLINTVAGDGQRQFSGENVTALAASFFSPKGVALDADGNIYIADTDNSKIRKINAATGLITTIAGNGFFGSSGDGGSALAASLASPLHIAVDRAGNVYLPDPRNHRVRKITAATGIISSIAGTGEAGFSGDNSPATSATLRSPNAVALDRNANIFVADTDNNRVRRIDARTGFISTVAGNGEVRFTGDGIQATATGLWRPLSIALDGAGNLFIADVNNNRIRKVSVTTGLITTVAGNGLQDLSGDNGPAVSASVYQPTSVAVDAAGNLFIVEIGLNRVRQVDARTGIIHNFAGGAGLIGDNGPATAATIVSPNGIAFDSAGNLAIGDVFNNRVRRVTPGTQMITTIAGRLFDPGAFAESGPATSINLQAPRGVAFDSTGNLYISDSSLHRVFMLDPAAAFLTTTVNGGGRFGTAGYSGDGGPPYSARINQPEAIAVDRSGNLIIADTADHRVRKVDFQRGIITTIAGSGQAAFSGDNGPGTSASLNQPSGLGVGPDGSIYIADRGNNRVRKIDPISGIITTVAGSGNTTFSIKNGQRTDDNGPATNATLIGPTAVVADSAGNLYINSFDNVRKVTAATGIITTIAGRLNSTTPRFGGDGGPAKDAALWGIRGLAFDKAGNLYIADGLNNRIRVIRGPLP